MKYGAKLHTAIATMLSLQAGMNAEVNPNWMTAGYAWPRAIWLEAGELMDHIGWKWWKASTPNYAQAQIELVDIWHFILSARLVQFKHLATESILEELNDPGKAVFSYGTGLVSLDELNLHQRVDLLASLAAQGWANVAVFDAVRESLGMSWDDLERVYVAKNVLNIFRQRNGYKDGSYIKMWNGQEDNVFLEAYMSDFPGTSPDGLFHALTHQYEQVKTRAQAQVGEGA